MPGLTLADPADRPTQGVPVNGHKRRLIITRVLGVIALICLFASIGGEFANALGVLAQPVDVSWPQSIFYAVFSGWLGVAANAQTET